MTFTSISLETQCNTVTLGYSTHRGVSLWTACYNSLRSVLECALTGAELWLVEGWRKETDFWTGGSGFCANQNRFRTEGGVSPAKSGRHSIPLSYKNVIRASRHVESQYQKQAPGVLHKIPKTNTRVGCPDCVRLYVCLSTVFSCETNSWFVCTTWRWRTTFWLKSCSKWKPWFSVV